MKPEPDHSRPRVHIVDSHDTSDAADDIIRGLDTLGVDGTAAVPTAPGQVRAVVVLISEAALRDPVWSARVTSLRAERLVPVPVGTVNDDHVPDYLRELNWIFYRHDDADFLARLFTGINTDASRFRYDRDTRALAERWESSDRNPDLLLEDPGEVRRRIRNAVADADGNDPLIPQEQVVQLAGTFGARYRFLREPIADTTEEEGLPGWIATPIALWLAAFQSRIDGMLAEEGTTPVAFLAASRIHASRLRRRRIRRISFRSILAAVTVTVIVATVVVVQEATKKSNNAVAFSIGEVALNGRPDLDAIKAGASLVDSGTFAGNDGRLRIVTDALSQHWSMGYLQVPGWAIGSPVVLEDGSVQAIDYRGAISTWDAASGGRSTVETGATGAVLYDAAPDGSLAVLTDTTSVSIVRDAAIVGTVDGFGSISGLALAPANDRVLVASGSDVWTADKISTNPAQPVQLGHWDTVIDVVQTSDGGAAALVERAGQLEIVHDDGTIDAAGQVPGDIAEGALASDGKSFALAVGPTVWATSDGVLAPSGIPLPGVVLAMGMTSDGLVLVSDRTLGSWVADPSLGIRLGLVCDGAVGTTSFTLAADGRILICANVNLTVESLEDLRPVASPATKPVTSVTSDGQVTSLSIVDGLIILNRSDGGSFALDPSGISFAPDFEQPAEVVAADFFATGAEIEASSLPTTVAVTPDGNTFAIGFVDGRLIEVDLNASGHMAPVGSWQLPDHSPVQQITWSSDAQWIMATTAAGSTWQRSSCAGCWKDLGFAERIAERVWTCYAAGDIDSLGDTPRTAFRLRDCETLWGDAP